MASLCPQDNSASAQVHSKNIKLIEKVSSYPWALRTNTAIPCHPETEAILRQVEFYFSDENLPQDAHLLARSGGDGNGAVSINEILSFKKMRRFKPPSQVKEALKLSKVLEVVNGKQIKRRYPLTVPLRVKPRLLPGRDHERIIAEKPWLTKGMLKPTGFETYATEGPLRPEEYEADRKAYDPEESFIYRIEIAVNRYAAKRKMHQLTRNVFTKFLAFGGFETSQRQFGGGFQEDELAGYDKDQIENIKCGFEVADMVVDGIDEDNGKGSTIWSVDFVSTAKAFLSSRLLVAVSFYDENAVACGVNVLRNFYNYLLLHDVCPEYTEQILQARSCCDVADEELPRIARLDRLLPGDFSKACSMLYEGHQSKSVADPTADWALPDDLPQWKEEETWMVLSAGMSAYGQMSELGALKLHKECKTKPQVIRDETIGLEVLSIQYAQGSPKTFFDAVSVKHTVIRPMGKLICKRWVIPHAPPVDLPKEAVEAEKARMGETLEFLINDEILDLCSVGIKFEVVVKTLDTGTTWMDCVIAVYPSFFIWLANEDIKDLKKKYASTAVAKSRNAVVDVQDDQDDQPD